MVKKVLTFIFNDNPSLVKRYKPKHPHLAILSNINALRILSFRSIHAE